MGDENKPKTFTWTGPNLNKVSYGRPFPDDISRTVPNKKEEVVMGGEIKQPPIEVVKKEVKEDNKFDPNEVMTLANEKMQENKMLERIAESKKPVIGAAFERIESPLKNLERHPNIDRVTVMQGQGGGSARAVAGTPSELEDLGITKGILGKKPVCGVVEPTKEDRTQTFLEPNK